MPDDWDEDFGGDWDLDGDELFLDDELDEDPGLGEAWGGADGVDLDDEEAEEDDWEAGLGGGTRLGLLDDEEEWEPAPGRHGASTGAPAGGGGGGGATTADAGRGQEAGERMSWSSWDVGVAFGLGGWMLDQHAEQIGRQVREALAEAGSLERASGRPLGAPHPPPPAGLAYDADAGALAVGDPLDPRRVYAEVVAARAAGRDLLLQAEGDAPAGGWLVLIVSVVPGSAGPGVWVVAEQRPGGFSASRLVPVFQADASGGFAVFATDLAAEAADAVAWAVGREGARSWALSVTRRAP